MPSIKKLSLAIVIALSMALLLSAGPTWLKPICKRYAAKQLQSLSQRTDISFSYSELNVIWGGVRIKGLNLRMPGVQSIGSLDIKFNFWPGPGFGKPERLIINNLQLTLQKSAKPISQAGSNSSPAVSVTTSFDESRLKQILRQGISLELKKTRLEIIDRHQVSLILIPRLDAIFSANDQQAELHIEGLRYRDQELLQTLDGQLILDSNRGQFPFSVTAQERGSGPWLLQGHLHQDLNVIEIRHKRSGLPLAWRKMLHNIEPQNSIELLLKLKIKGLAKGTSLDFDAQLASTNLRIRHPLLSSEAIGPLPFTVRAQGNFDPEQSSLSVERGLIYLLQAEGPAHIKSTFALLKNDLLAPASLDPWQINWKLAETPCQALLDIIPKETLPLLKNFQLSGSVKLEANAQLMPQQGRALVFPARAQAISCRVAKTPTLLSKNWIKQRIAGPESINMQKNPSIKAFFSENYLPIAQISEDFLRGIIAAEDAGFWQHEGFRPDSLVAAMQANIKAGKVLFGGSTITMQMVKNLYLNHEKVLSRKLQELFLSWVIEQTLTKQEILEIYANIIEFGPGIFGINRASSVYFGKPASQLSTAEALFFASILPRPGHHYRSSFCVGRLELPLQQRMLKVATSLASMQGNQPIMAAYASALRDLQFNGQSPCRSELFIGKKTPRDLKSF